MNLPLLALKPCGVGAPFPETEVKLVIEFKDGNATVTTLQPEDSLNKSDPLVQVADRLRQWVCSGIVKVKGEGIELSDGARSWQISWKEFNDSVATHTCKSANSDGDHRRLRHRRPRRRLPPYALTHFEQLMLDSEGWQKLFFTFSVYIDRLQEYRAQ